jgi:hypothetical protein
MAAIDKNRVVAVKQTSFFIYQFATCFSSDGPSLGDS